MDIMFLEAKKLKKHECNFFANWKSSKSMRFICCNLEKT
eukprot:UN06157